MSNFLKYLSKLLIIIIYFPITIICNITFKIFKIKIVKIRSDRIGHFAEDSAEQIARLNEHNSIKKTIFCFDKIVVNKQWEKMVRRTLHVNNFFYYVYKINERFFKSLNLIGKSTETFSRDIDLLYEKYDVKIRFTDKENIEGQNWLKTQGIKPDDKFICLMVRDDQYLKECSSNYLYDIDINWDYHNYRDGDAQTYFLGLDWLTTKGFSIIRMGKSAKKPLKNNNKKIIDYAFCDKKSDFLDIWLTANCYACISSGTGLDSIAHVYGKPTLFVNYLPFEHVTTYMYSITSPKNLYWNKSKRKFTLHEYIKFSFNTYEEYINKNITIIDLSEKQILDCIKEFCIILNDEVKAEKFERLDKLRKKFLNEYMKTKNYYKFNNLIHKNFYISDVFFRKKIKN